MVISMKIAKMICYHAIFANCYERDLLEPTNKKHTLIEKSTEGVK